MAQKQLIVQVHKDGTVNAETIGMFGDECLDYISVLEDLLEAETVQSSYTADYRRIEATSDQLSAQRDWDAAQ